MHPFIATLDFAGIQRPIGSYGVMLTLAMVAGMLLAARAAHRDGLDVGAVFSLVGLALLGGLIGAWTTFILVEWVRTGSPLEAIRSGGGLVFYGSAVGGGATMVILAPRFGVPVLRFFDVAVVALPVAHALGRIGCFLGGCCYGSEWDGPWAVRYTHWLAPGRDGFSRHPTQLYEALGLLALALAFALTTPKRVGNGVRAASYVIAYGALRFFVEMFRGDSIRGVFAANLSTSQWLSTMFVLFALGYVVVQSRRPARVGAVR